MEKKEVRPFGLIDKLAYMCGDVANDLSFIFVSMYLLVFYTKVLGVSGKVVGTLFLTARIVDAFTDVGMGRIVDGMKPRKEGKFRFWIKNVAPFVCFSSFLLFVHVVQYLPMSLKIVYIFATYIIWGSICYTAVNIPYGSMASVISDQTEDRAALSVFRNLGANISIFVIGILVPKFVYVEKLVDGKYVDVVSPIRFTIIAAIFSSLAFCFYMLCYKYSIERVQQNEEEKIVKEKKSTSTEVLGLIKSLLNNRPLQSFILLAIVLLMSTMLGQGLLPYVYTDYFSDKNILGYASITGPIVTFSIAFIAAKLAKIFGKQLAGATALLFAGIVFGIMYLLKIDSAVTFFIIFIIATLGSSFFNIIIWAFISDIIDDQEVREGKREDGTVYAIYSFARKVGQALAGGITGFALSFIGYESSALVQTDAVRHSIYNLYTGVQAGGFILCGIILLFIFPLTKKRVESNTEELKRRRGE